MFNDRNTVRTEHISFRRCILILIVELDVWEEEEKKFLKLGLEFAGRTFKSTSILAENAFILI